MAFKYETLSTEEQEALRSTPNPGMPGITGLTNHPLASPFVKDQIRQGEIEHVRISRQLSILEEHIENLRKQEANGES